MTVSPFVFTVSQHCFQQKLRFVHRKNASFSFSSNNNLFISYTNGKIFKILFAHSHAKNTGRQGDSEEGSVLADKKSFLLYFDMFPCICELPPEQQGVLFSAIFRYADAVWRNNSSKSEILQEFPQMQEATRMAFSFIAETIRRDTEKWQEKQNRYQKAALERWEKNHRQEDEAWIQKYL